MRFWICLASWQSAKERLQQADASTVKTSWEHANELAKISDQLLAALEYRRKCRSQQAEIKRLQEKIAGLQAEQRHASEQDMHADKRPASQQSLKDSQFRTGFLQKPAQAADVSVQPTTGQQIRAGAAEESQVASLQEDVVLNSQVDELLRKLQEAERRVQQEAQKRREERKNIREVLRRRDEDLKAWKASSEAFRKRLIELGALQEPAVTESRHCSTPLRHPCSDGLYTEHPQEHEATSKPAKGSARQGRQQAEQPRDLSPAQVTPTASGRGVVPQS